MAGFLESTHTETFDGNDQSLDDAARAALKNLEWDFKDEEGTIVGTTKTTMLGGFKEKFTVHRAGLTVSFTSKNGNNAKRFFSEIEATGLALKQNIGTPDDEQRRTDGKALSTRIEKAFLQIEPKHQRFLHSAADKVGSRLQPGENVLAMSEYDLGSIGLLTVTDVRVISVSGATAEYFHDTIGSVQSVMRILTLYVQGKQVNFPHVAKNRIEELTSLISQQIGKAREPKPAASIAVAGIDIASQLEKLDDLRQKGILTDDEFASQKAKLLA